MGASSLYYKSIITVTLTPDNTFPVISVYLLGRSVSYRL